MDILGFRSLLIKIIPFSTELQLVVCLPDVIVARRSHTVLWSGYKSILKNLKCFFLFAFNFLFGIFCNEDMEIHHDIEIIRLAVRFFLLIS